MSTRPPNRSRSTTATSKRRKKVTPRRTKTARGKKGRKKKRTRKQRSEAAKRGWQKRRKRARLIERMEQAGADLDEWRRTALPTRDELHEWLEWGAERLGVDIGQMYKWYWGS